VLSLGAGITMLMAESGDDPSRSGGRDILDSRLAGNGSSSGREQSSPAEDRAEGEASERERAARHVWLPPRSLLILEGRARGQWTHGIAPRRSDMLPGLGLLARQRRVSLTFRQAIAADGARLEVAAAALGNPAQATAATAPAADAVDAVADAAAAEAAVKQGRRDEIKTNIARKKEKKRLAAEERARLRALEGGGGGGGGAGGAAPREKVPSSIPLSEDASRGMDTGVET
jgi:hypothetical protein